MATQVAPGAGTAAQLNKELNKVGAAIATDLAPGHAEVIKGIAKEEPAIFKLIMALVRGIRKSKHRK